jgi:hypothetical protein
MALTSRFAGHRSAIRWLRSLRLTVQWAVVTSPAGSLYALPCLVGVDPLPDGSIVEFFPVGSIALIYCWVCAGLGTVGCRFS